MICSARPALIGCLAGLALATPTLAQEDPVRVGDIALGLGIAVNNTSVPPITEAFSRANTLRQVRGGEKVSPGWAQGIELQSMEFDNANGLSHNARGNLLGLVFNPLSTSTVFPVANLGGSLWQVSTNGSNQVTRLFDFTVGATSEGTRQRVGGLSVSPNNDKVALASFDSGKIFILDYVQGGAVGTGTGASVSNFRKTAVLNTISHTAGTAWLDNNTVITAMTNIAIPTIYTVDATTLVATPVVTLLPFANSGNSRVTDIEYNPLISPYVYVLYSLFAGDTENLFAVVDPSTWTVLKTIGVGGSLETGRELAFGPDQRLYMSQFAGSGSLRYMDVLQLDLTAPFGTIDAADTALLFDSSTNDHYRKSTADLTGSPVITSNFSGLDIALTSPVVDPAPDAVGSCCLPSGAGCIALVTNVACTNNLGTWNGAGTSCTPFCPSPTGACCQGASCVVLTKIACDSALGLYYGDASTCTTNACNGPGACCLTDGSCSSLSMNDCYIAGGLFQGIGIVCGVCPTIPSAVVTTFDFDVALPFVASGRNLSYSANPNLNAPSQVIQGAFQRADGTAYPGHNSDVFGIVDRLVSTDFADDTTGSLPQDVFGIISVSKTDKFFGIQDLTNTDSGGTGTSTGTATWSFDISGFNGLAVTMDFASHGNFEDTTNPTATRDTFTFRYSIDGGPATELFISDVLEGTPCFTVMDAGTRAQYGTGTELRDPVSLRASGTLNFIQIRNDFIRMIRTGIASGSTLTITLTATGDGQQEVFAIDNIRVLGTPVPVNGACCCGSTCTITTAAACVGTNQSFAGINTVCTPFSLTAPCCRGDYNKSAGIVSVQDIFDFLGGYFSGDSCADTNDSGGANSVQDIFDYLSAYFAGC